ncbi:MAG TPA: hypothetical protein VG756_33005 [Pseudonocardiaceae bacterium]|nr:hypothetical protein [Pseudonocardiaceae bacterium]
MGFHTEDDLRQLGSDVAQAAHDAVRREAERSNASLGAPGAVVVADDKFYSHYPELYASFATPDPAGMQPALDALAKISFSLTHKFPVGNPGGSDLPVPARDMGNLAQKEVPETISNHLKDDIRSWQGTARDAFENSVLDSFSEKWVNQAAAINALAGSLVNHMYLRSKLNSDVWNLGQQSIAAFKKVGMPSWDFMLNLTLDVVGASMAVWSVWGAAIEVEGIAAGLANITFKDGLSAVSGFNTVGKDLAGDKNAKLDFSNAQEVGSSMQKNLAGVATSYQDQEKQVIAAMQTLSAGMKAPDTVGLFEFSVPDAVNQLNSAKNTNDLDSEFTPEFSG